MSDAAALQLKRAAVSVASIIGAVFMFATGHETPGGMLLCFAFLVY